MIIKIILYIVIQIATFVGIVVMLMSNQKSGVYPPDGDSIIIPIFNYLVLSFISVLYFFATCYFWFRNSLMGSCPWWSALLRVGIVIVLPVFIAVIHYSFLNDSNHEFMGFAAIGWTVIWGLIGFAAYRHMTGWGLHDASHKTPANQSLSGSA